MTKITVYEFNYLDPEQGSRVKGYGMFPESTIKALREKDPDKAHQLLESSGIEIDESELTDGRYCLGSMEEVKVTNPAPDTYSDITEFTFEHSCLVNAVMSYYRNPETDIITLACNSCNFSFSFQQLSDEATIIARVAIDGEARDLPNQNVRIVPNN